MNKTHRYSPAPGASVPVLSSTDYRSPVGAALKAPDTPGPA